MKKPTRVNPMEFFQKLGVIVEGQWRDRNYKTEDFPRIAATALTEHSPAGQVDPWEIIRALGSDRALPGQQDIEGNFGNPPITLFAGSRFYIDIYFWLDGTTAIHQHSFAGAFQVLLGSSIHSHYDFAIEQSINTQFSLGRLSLKDVELLSVGDIKQINPGSRYIHSLFHLDRPSATITIRTVGLPDAQPQFSYLKPGIAFDPFFKEARLIKKRQSANLLFGMQHPEADAIVAEIISASDLHTTFMVLDTVYQNLRGSGLEKSLGVSPGMDRFDKLLAVARAKHGRWVDYFPVAFSESERQLDLVQRRAYVHSAELRFFFALLLNVTGSKRILDLVKHRFPDKPAIETVLDWVEELSQTKAFGWNEPNALGIEFGDQHLLVLECLLKNKTLSQTKKELRSIYQTSDLGKIDSQISTIYEELLSARIFQPLLADRTRSS